jgi:membrane-associated protease RseP (regulator of RpoE activity)
MEHGLLLILLGLLSYFIVQNSAKKTLTKTPVWLLWLVTMIPALVWTAWLLIFGEETPLPTWLVVTPFLVSPLLYGWLVQSGRIEPKATAKPTSESKPVAVVNKSQPQAIEIKPITANEEVALRNCFPWGIYYLQNIDYRPQAILCRGKLKTIPEEAYQTIKQNIEKVFGDRFLLLFQESLSGQPFFALVPNVWAQKTAQNREDTDNPLLALGLLLITLFTTTIIGVEFSGIPSQEFQNNPKLLLAGLPYSLAIMAIFGIHELSHYFTAIYYKIKVTLPYFIPVPFFLGTVGAFIQMRTPAPHRKALFDTAIAGPIAGFLVTVPILLWGLMQSETVIEADAMTLRENSTSLELFTTFNPRFSLLMSLFAKIALASKLQPETYLNLHPLAIAGFIGLLVTAFNLVPVGQLDGGHIVHAMLGQNQGVLVGQITRLLMFILAMIQPPLIQPIFLIWAITLLLIPVTCQPALNDVTELDNKRDILGLFSLLLLLLILLPLPKGLGF